MDERGISRNDVEATIALGKKADTPGGVRIAIHQTKFGRLVVKYRIVNGLEIKVITTYY
jgi:hypothetical protein